MMGKVKEYAIINLGIFLVSIEIYFFKVPNHFITGGTGGISIILENRFSGASVGSIMMLLNISLLLIGFIFSGFSFGAKTVYATIVLSGIIWILEKLLPLPYPITNSTILELLCATVFNGLGSAILFSQNASTGGTDIIAKIINQYIHVKMGTALLLTDLLIATMAIPVFGIKIGLYSIIGLIMRCFVIDMITKRGVENKRVAEQQKM